MPQELVISNGNYLANLDEHLQIRDIYFPYIGQENHSAFGKAHRVGVWIDGQFSWLSDDGWEFSIDYHTNTLVGDSTATHKALGIQLHFQDFIYTTHDVLVRSIGVTNMADSEREIRLFFGHDFYLYGDKQQDTAIYEPEFNGVLHYRQRRYFLVNGRWADTKKGMTQFSVGKSNYGNKEGTWKDAEDGHLHMNPIEQGSVDSTVGFYRFFEPHATHTLNVWIAAGRNYAEIQKINERVVGMSVKRIMAHTSNYWKEWASKHSIALSGVDQKTEALWYRSLLMIRTQTDNRGAIIASNDSDIMKFNKDTYTYMWPRDGALVSMTLSRTGYFGMVERFLRFCNRMMHPDGYMLHKFTPGGEVGSSWHAKWKNGRSMLPIQEDETALVLVAMHEYYKHSKNIDVIQEHFNSMVLRMGRFLMRYVDDATGLPLPSHDLWEEQYGVFSYTAATVYAGLVAAAELSKATGHYHDEDIFHRSAVAMQSVIQEKLFSKTENRFVKRLIVNHDGPEKYTEDTTVDASIAFMWEMGVLPPDHPKIVSTMHAIKQHLSVPTAAGGLCRYPGDTYHKDWNADYGNVPGNPWIITTLWLANWYIATAKNRADLSQAKEIIQWARNHANQAGILAEQMHPITEEPLSVAPLTWSHSTYVDTVRRYSEAYKKLK